MANCRQSAWRTVGVVPDRFPQLLTLDAEDRIYQPRGTFDRWCQAACADLTDDFMLAEFGTYPMLRVLKALRAENRGVALCGAGIAALQSGER
ncbi:hypothetical protein [Chamaesiphon sp. VAR_69_metabat_338]|uniref:hypothetical protein n=1 Tax=Chamaesiphon sp. VAR_69_metabat_338 TaxID=2964704 RepID=UPI00286E0F34|nr:hypothetical protein [Chamaesiphon sp. VAR_69_metabat_338]